MKLLKQILFLTAFLGICITIILLAYKDQKPAKFTNLMIKNSSKEDSVKVYVTLQSPNSVIGLFGIKDTVGSGSKGYFYAHKNKVYASNTSATLLGVVISFSGDNWPCQTAIQKGFYTGVNIFECSINTKFEVFDISCEDGVNCAIKTSVSDTNWTAGDGLNQIPFRTATNNCSVGKNLNIPGVFPYRCTDCVDLGTAIPQNCFNLPDTCNSVRQCQVARTGLKGGAIKIEYLGNCLIPCK